MASDSGNEKEKTGFSLEPVRGLRDFLPDEQSQRQRVMDTLREVYERYGFLPLETPVMESFDVLSSKYAGGAEILKETYQLTDQGQRKLGLRYDLTVPLCRVVANNPNLAKPFKRYQIAPVFRDGPIRVGRYREFIQADCDTLGAPFGLADAELLALAVQAYDALGLKVIIKVNDRKLLSGLLESTRVPEEKRGDAMLTLDKLDKIGMGGVAQELLGQRKLSKECVDSLVAILTMLQKAESDEQTLDILEKQLSSNQTAMDGIRELKELLAMVDSFGASVRLKVKLDPLLARGFAYYTGPVFEAYLTDDVLGRAVGGGGRYDELVGAFLGLKGDRVPAVGFSVGFDTVIEALRLQKGEGAVTSVKSSIRVFVVPIGPEARPKCLEYVQRIRRAGLNAAIDLLGRGPSKNLDYANKAGIPYALIVGKQEIDAGKAKLKDLRTGEEKLASIETILELLTDEQAMGKL